MIFGLGLFQDRILNKAQTTRSAVGHHLGVNDG